MYCDTETLTIGSGGHGPAIYLDKELYKGVTNACETFNSPILIKGAERHVDDAFKAKNVEVYIL